MTQPELIDKLKPATGFSDVQIKSLLASLGDALRTHCKELDAVAIPGFGTFQPVKSDEKIVDDAVSGKRTLMPPSIVVKLKSSVVLRKRFVG